jgi:hypothetical protein
MNTYPNPAVVHAFYVRFLEWKKEQALQPKRVLALQMRKKSSGKHLAVRSEQKASKA